MAGGWWLGTKDRYSDFNKANRHMNRGCSAYKSYIQLVGREFNGKGFPLVLFSFCSLGNYSGGLSQGVMLMDWVGGGGGLALCSCCLFWFFFYLALAISFYFVQMVF